MTLAQDVTTAATAGVEARVATPAELARWDDIVRRFPNARITHTRAWIASLCDGGAGAPLFLVFERGGEIVGALPGLLTAALGVRIFGSPREGWQTVSMGPVFDPARTDGAGLIAAAVQLLEREHRVAHVEIMSPSLDAASMEAAGFSGERVPTFRAPLFPGDEPRTLQNLKDSARRNIKRARRLGLDARIEDDERFAEELYDQLVDVYARGGHAVPFSSERVLACFRRLRSAGSLIAVGVYLPGSRRCIAAGMFFAEGRELSLWMWAHRHHYRWYRPTELLTWTAMQRAMALGCDTFDLMGRGEFKRVFGAELDETKTRWMRSRPQWLGTARRIAAAGFRAQQAVRGKALVLAARSRGADRAGTAPAVVMGDVDLVRGLGLGGIRSVVLAPEGSAARYSRFTAAALPWSDPWDRPEEVVERLVDYGFSQPEPPVLFYQEDRSLLLVSRFRDRLRQAFRFVIADGELVEQLVDKQRFQQLAAKLKLPVPPARAVSPADEAVPADLWFPVIVKPVVRRNSQWQPVVGDGKAMRIDSLAALAELWPRLAAARASVLLQSLIDGPESRIESYHTYVDDKGQIAAEFTGRKIRTSPPLYGDTSSLVITDAPDVAALGREATQKLNLHGVAKLDFKRAADGTLYLLEVNPRFTLWHHAGALAGANIPALVYGDLTGKTRPAAAPARAGVRWVKPWTDRASARAEGISFVRWLPWMLDSEAKSAVALDDPMPLVGAGLWRRFSRRAQQAPAPESRQLVPNPVGPR